MKTITYNTFYYCKQTTIAVTPFLDICNDLTSDLYDRICL
jgi:hypothetical protein